MINLNLDSKNVSKKSAIQDHVNSGSHKEALKKEKARLSMVKATSNAVNHANKHIESLMKIIYFMAKNNLPLYQFSQLVQLGCTLESPNLISNSNSITYKNPTSAKDLLLAISLSIEKELWNALYETTSIGIMIDESTDISTELHIILYIKYCLRGFIKVRYVKLLYLNDKDAETIFLAIFTLFELKGKNLPLIY